MGEWIKDLMNYFKQLDRSKVNKALYLRQKISSKVSHFIKPGELFCFPTVPMIPPKKRELDNHEQCDDYYTRTMRITSFSGVANLPEISIPVTKIEKCTHWLVYCRSSLPG